MTQHSPLVSERHVAGTAVLGLRNPPVNSLGPDLRAALMAALERALADTSVRSVVLVGDGRMFCGGADIREFDQGAIGNPDPNLLNEALENSAKPVVAAIHGMALGGGLELAMACHARVADAGAQFALPEVKLGILPGAGGTQRLPRLVGIATAVDMMLAGTTVGAAGALASGLVDAIAEGALLDAAVALAGRLASAGAGPRVTSRLVVAPVEGDGNAAYFTARRGEAAQRQRGQPAPARILDCVERAARGDGFAHALAQERADFLALMASPESLAMRHLFFAEREAGRPPSDGADRTAVSGVGILGAGTMGSGIALNFLAAGLPTTLVDIGAAALERGRASIESTLRAAVAKGRIGPQDLERQLALLRTATDMQALAGCDLVIEAVYEDLALKKTVVAELGRVCKPQALVATNTSTLDVDALAAASGRPDRFLGLHFFSPANIMRLLEVVRGAHTGPGVVATALALGKAIGKTPVVSGVCYGFIGNRMLESYLRETDRLLLEGCTPRQIDTALENFGMAMGPCRMMDLSGVDVNANVLQQHLLAGFAPPDPAYRAVCLALHAEGRNGQKSSRGYYRYEGRTAIEDAETQAIVAGLAARHGIGRRPQIAEREIVERCLYPLVNEGFHILAEGIAQRSGDIDVVWTAGYGFPRHRGGPMFFAGQAGLAHVAERLRHYGARPGAFASDWEPADHLLALAGAEQAEPSHA